MSEVREWYPWGLGSQSSSAFSAQGIHCRAALYSLLEEHGAGDSYGETISDLEWARVVELKATGTGCRGRTELPEKACQTFKVVDIRLPAHVRPLSEFAARSDAPHHCSSSTGNAVSLSFEPGSAAVEVRAPSAVDTLSDNSLLLTRHGISSKVL